MLRSFSLKDLSLEAAFSCSLPSPLAPKPLSVASSQDSLLSSCCLPALGSSRFPAGDARLGQPWRGSGATAASKSHGNVCFGKPGSSGCLCLNMECFGSAEPQSRVRGGSLDAAVPCKSHPIPSATEDGAARGRDSPHFPIFFHLFPLTFLFPHFSFPVFLSSLPLFFLHFHLNSFLSPFFPFTISFRFPCFPFISFLFPLLPFPCFVPFSPFPFPWSLFPPFPLPTSFFSPFPFTQSLSFPPLFPFPHFPSFFPLPSQGGSSEVGSADPRVVPSLWPRSGCAPGLVPLP